MHNGGAITGYHCYVLRHRYTLYIVAHLAESLHIILIVIGAWSNKAMHMCVHMIIVCDTFSLLSLQVWVKGSPHISDYVRVTVSYAIIPSLATVHLGAKICFTTHLTEGYLLPTNHTL